MLAGTLGSPALHSDAMVALHDGVQDANALAGYGGLVLSHSHSPYLSPVLGPEKSLSMLRVPKDSPAITAGPFRSSSPFWLRIMMLLKPVLLLVGFQVVLYVVCRPHCHLFPLQQKILVKTVIYGNYV